MTEEELTTWLTETEEGRTFLAAVRLVHPDGSWVHCDYPDRSPRCVGQSSRGDVWVDADTPTGPKPMYYTMLPGMNGHPLIWVRTEADARARLAKGGYISAVAVYANGTTSTILPRG